MATWEGTQAHHEERLRLIIEAAPSAMIMVNDDGQIMLVNSEAEHSFGYGREDLLAMNIEQLVPERFRAEHAGHRTWLRVASSSACAATAPRSRSS